MRTVNHPMYQSKIQLWLAIASVSCLLLQSASATLIYSEAFNYTAGSTLGGQVNPSGATWLVGNSHITIASGDLTYASGGATLVDQGGNSLSISNVASGSGVAVDTFANQTSGQIFYSFLLDVTTANGGNNYLTALNPGTSGPNGGSDAIDCYVYSSGKLGIRTSGASTTTTANPAISLNTTYFIVEEYDFSAASAYLYLDPTPGAAMPAPTLSLANVNGVSSIDNVGFKVQSSTGSFIVDNLLVANNSDGNGFANVTQAVPEPSTLALAGLGLGLMFAAIRRYRR